MNTDKNLQFISKCISDAGQAMVYRCFDEDHKQLLGFKNSLTVDDNGQLYFALNTQFEENFTSDTFPVELFVYKKGNAYCVKAKGIAQKNVLNKNICVKMDEIEVLQTNPVNNQQNTNYLRNLLVNTGKYVGII